MMKTFSDAILVEYADLHRRRAEEIVRISSARATIDDLDQKIAGFPALLAAYALKLRAEAYGYLAECYTRGFPDHIILDVLADILDPPYTHQDLAVSVASLGLRRPEGWSPEQAEQDFCNDDLDTLSGIAVIGVVSDHKRQRDALPSFSEATEKTMDAGLEQESLVVSPESAKDEPTALAQPRPEPPESIAPQSLEGVLPKLSTTRYPKHGQVTPARDVIMRREYPLGTSRAEIRAMLNALPGVMFPVDTDIPIYAGRLKLHRPKGYVAEKKIRETTPRKAKALVRATPASLFPIFLRSVSRDLIVKIGQEEGVSDLEILERINATPGVTLKLTEVAAYARAVAFEQAILSVDEPSPTLAPSPTVEADAQITNPIKPPIVAGPTPTAVKLSPRLKIRSPERDAALRLDWPNGVPIADILSKLNGLPGSSINHQQVRHYAYLLKLSRPEWYRSEQGRKARSVLRGKSKATVAVAQSNEPPQALKAEPTAASGTNPAPKPAQAAEIDASIDQSPAAKPSEQIKTKPEQPRSSRWFPSQAFVKRHLETKKGYPSPEDIESHIRTKGVTKLPAAIVADTTAELSADDRKALSAHASEMQAAWEAANVRSIHKRKPNQTKAAPDDGKPDNGRPDDADSVAHLQGAIA